MFQVLEQSDIEVTMQDVRVMHDEVLIEWVGGNVDELIKLEEDVRLCTLVWEISRESFALVRDTPLNSKSAIGEFQIQTIWMFGCVVAPC